MACFFSKCAQIGHHLRPVLTTKLAMAETVPKHEMDLTELKPYDDKEMAENTMISTIVSNSTEGPVRKKNVLELLSP